MKNKENNEGKMDKFIGAVSTIGIGFSLSTVLMSVLGLTASEEYLAYLTASTVISSPFIGMGLKKAKEHLDFTTSRDAHQVSQLALMLRELTNKTNKIGKMTSLFAQEILATFEKNNVPLLESEVMHINQFLYLVNANYYEAIDESSYATMTRDLLINDLIEEISAYFEETGETIFAEETAKSVLKRIPYIDDTIKEAIYKEFKKSKIKFKGTTDYGIIRRDVQSGQLSYLMEHLNEEKKLGTSPTFDAENLSDYRALIDSVADLKEFEEENYGNPKNLIWDMDLLRTIIKTISRHSQEIEEYRGEYSLFNVAASFIYNASLYATLNNRREVGLQEQLNTFKEWPYLPFELRLDVLDEVFTENGISYENHPFNLTKARRQKTKIIKFNPHTSSSKNTEND